MNLRKLAQGQDCQIRIPGVCNFNPETTVLCHIRKAGVAGAGMKPPDICGVWGCSDCHSCIDKRVESNYTDDQLNSFILYALCRTLNEISKIYPKLKSG